MKLSGSILKHINEGTLNALSFDDDIPSEEEVKIRKISNKSVLHTNDMKQMKAYLQNRLPDAMEVDAEFINIALEYYNKYGVTYNPGLDDEEFRFFIECCIEETDNEADLNWIDTSEVTNMAYLFPNKYEFNGDISKWDTSKVIKMNKMFYNTLFNGDISNWDVSNVENMNEMFRNSSYTGENGDLSKWNLKKDISMDQMFFNSAYSGDLQWLNFTEEARYVFSKDGISEHENLAECLQRNLIAGRISFDDFLRQYTDNTASFYNRKNKGLFGKITEEYIQYAANNNIELDKDTLAFLYKTKNWSDAFYTAVNKLLNNDIDQNDLSSDEELLKALVDIKRFNNERDTLDYVQKYNRIFSKLINRKFDANNPILQYLLKTQIINGHPTPIFNSFLKDYDIIITPKE